MANFKTRRKKLLAVIDPKSGATDGERANAQSLLVLHDAKAPVFAPLTREEILETEDEPLAPRPPRYRDGQRIRT